LNVLPLLPWYSIAKGGLAFAIDSGKRLPKQISR
jgi:hypothetical protein